MNDLELSTYLEDRRARVDQALDRLLAIPGGGDPGRLREGMRYAVLQGGKRMRPMVVIAACEAAGGTADDALPACCAIELVHAYSLVHDDLPAMDDDVERRGKPTVHVAFGEAPAILVGDALLTAAFTALVGGPGRSDVHMARAVARLAHHAGIDGMVGGQAMDLEQGQDIRDLALLEQVHALKTGGLYAASGAMGALCARASDEAVDRLERWGLAFGIAFQHADDVLDDDQPQLRAQAVTRVETLVQECQTLASQFGDRGRALRALAHWVGARTRDAVSGIKAD